MQSASSNHQLLCSANISQKNTSSAWKVGLEIRTRFDLEVKTSEGSMVEIWNSNIVPCPRKGGPFVCSLHKKLSIPLMPLLVCDSNLRVNICIRYHAPCFVETLQVHALCQCQIVSHFGVQPPQWYQFDIFRRSLAQHHVRGLITCRN